MMLFADEAVAQANTTANTSLVFSICSFVLVPLVTLWLNKFFENRKQDSEATTTKARIDGDAVVARAKVESEAAIAKAKLELDSKLLVLTAQHNDCVKNHMDVERKLDECEKQHFVSLAERQKLKEVSEDNRIKIEKFEEFMAKHEARRLAAAENI